MPDTTAGDSRFIPISAASRTYGLSPNMIRAMGRRGLLSLYRPTGEKAILVEVKEIEALFASSKIATD